MEKEIRGHTLAYWEANANEDYKQTPISVLKYITILEEELKVKNNVAKGNLSNSFISLIDRLERASNIKYPNRLWNAEFKKNMVAMWMDKDNDLLIRVEQLESEIYDC